METDMPTGMAGLYQMGATLGMQEARVNFQQLRIIREAARRDYNLTEVANALFTSQSGVSRHIRELEEELGIALFVRYGKRLLGMTEPGKELLVLAERILNDAGNIRKLASAFANRESGRLLVATTQIGRASCRERV